jgi:hypothetical protein
VSACAAAGDLLDDGSRVGGQLDAIVQGPEVAVIDDSDDLRAQWLTSTARSGAGQDRAVLGPRERAGDPPARGGSDLAKLVE